MRIKSILGILAVFFLVWSIYPASAEDWTNVSSCMDITESGNYRLNQSISGLLSGQNYCIGIFADDVVLDGQGYLVTGTGSGKGILVQANNVTVTNVSVSGYEYGIYLQSSNDSIIKDCLVVYNTGDGLTLDDSNDSTIENCTISNNEITGIYAYSSENNTIKNCTIDQNDDGIFLHLSNNNKITNTTISNSLSNGILLENSENNLIYNNLFNNTKNATYTSYVKLNNWNITLQQGTNILGGNWLGGNAWLKPDGTGYSQTCIDAQEPIGICDEVY
ncbi:MAG: NosD domain-containing protein, partial [Archaeoglobaceae archaeon]